MVSDLPTCTYTSIVQAHQHHNVVETSVYVLYVLNVVQLCVPYLVLIKLKHHQMVNDGGNYTIAYIALI